MNLRIRTPLQILCPALVVLLGAGTAAATDYTGSTVDFLNVTQTTNSAGDPADLYGTGTVSGDQLGFSPSNFTAYTSGNYTSDSADSLLSIDIVVTALGATIDTVTLSEFGQSILSGPAGTGATGTIVTLSGSTTITEQGGVDTPDIPGPAINAVFSPNYFFALPGDTGTVNWSGTALLDFTAFSPNATRVHLQIDNVVQAFSETTSNTAEMTKSSFAISVPEPGTLSLLGLGMLGSLVLGRRRS